MMSTTIRYALLVVESPRWMPESVRGEPVRRVAGHYAGLDLAQDAAATQTDPWVIERQTCRVGESICTADRGQPEVQVLEHVIVDSGPLPAEPPKGCGRYTVLGRTMDLPHDLARAAGLGSAWSSGDLYFAQAFSEGLAGIAAAYRAAALHAERVAASEARTSAQKVADSEIHAARIRRQAAMLECRARGVSSEIREG